MQRDDRRMHRHTSVGLYSALSFPPVFHTEWEVDSVSTEEVSSLCESRIKAQFLEKSHIVSLTRPMIPFSESWLLPALHAGASNSSERHVSWQCFHWEITSVIGFSVLQQISCWRSRKPDFCCCCCLFDFSPLLFSKMRSSFMQVKDIMSGNKLMSLCFSCLLYFPSVVCVLNLGVRKSTCSPWLRNWGTAKIGHGKHSFPPVGIFVDFINKRINQTVEDPLKGFSGKQHL